MAEKLVHIDCRGCDFDGKPALKKPIKVIVELHKRPGSTSISVGPKDCRFNTGGHGQRCKASHPGEDKVGDGINCPYAFDYPYATRLQGWKPPHKVRGALKQLIA